MYFLAAMAARRVGFMRPTATRVGRQRTSNFKCGNQGRVGLVLHEEDTCYNVAVNGPRTPSP